MSTNPLKPRTASDLCIGYITSQREQANRQRVLHDVNEFMTKMKAEYGASLAFAGMARYVGLMLVEFPHDLVVRVACRVLAKRIIRSTWERLTAPFRLG
jgi:hypothetical protein